MPLMKTYDPSSDAERVFGFVSEPMTFYVNPAADPDGTGSEANPFNTIAAATAFVSRTFWGAGSDSSFLTLKLAAGVYAESVRLPNIAGVVGILEGDNANPESVIIRPPAGFGPAVGLTNNMPSYWRAGGLQVDSVNLNNFATLITAQSNGILSFQDGPISLKLKAGVTAFNSSHGGKLYVYADTTIRGDGAIQLLTAYEDAMAQLLCNINFVDALAFSSACVNVSNRVNATISMTKTGAAVTGTRANASKIAVIDTYGAGQASIPGNANGTIDNATGGYLV